MKLSYIVKNPIVRNIDKAALRGISMILGAQKAENLRSKIKLIAFGSPAVFDAEAASKKTIDPNKTLTQNLKMLFKIPRMGHVGLDNANSVKGLYKMVQKYFKPEFEVVEVGSFHGVSTMLFSLFAKKVDSVDCYAYVIPPTGRIPAMDKLMADAENVFLARTANLKNIVKIKKTSLEASRDFKDGSLDAVYIDAEHDADNVRLDIQTWRKKVKKGGILAGHDWTLPHIPVILKEENLTHNLSVYPDTSWSVEI